MDMLNKLILLAVGQMMSTFVWAQHLPTAQTFTLKGKVPPAYIQDTLTLWYIDDGVKHGDTLTLTRGSFSLEGKIARPTMAFLSLIRHKKPAKPDEGLLFYIEPGGAVEIAGHHNWKEFSITGGPVQDDWSEFTKLRDRLLQGYPDYPSIDVRTDEGRVMAEKWKQQYKKAQNAFIVAHPSSFISWEQIKNRTTVIDDNPYVLEALMEVLDSSFHTEPRYEGAVQRINALKNIVIGKPAPDFVSYDTLGNKHTLADFRGKYVLLDFWASWCGFCRYQLPELTRVYEKYKHNNFIVVGVSYDDSKERWLKAIREDKTPFIQIGELKKISESPSAKAYGITAIPQNIMLDPEGNIVARNIGLLDFDKKIGEILSGKMTVAK